MPNTKSADKRMRTSAARQVRNREAKTRILTARRRLFAATAAGNRSEAEQRFRLYCAVLDKAVKKGTIRANNADRRKSRAAARVAKMA